MCEANSVRDSVTILHYVNTGTLKSPNLGITNKINIGHKSLFEFTRILIQHNIILNDCLILVEHC